MLGVRIATTSNVARVEIERMRVRASDLSPALESFASRRRRRHEEIFDGEQSPYGDRHQKLKPETVRRKRMRGYDLRILHATNRMRNSFFLTVGRRRVEWGYGSPVAKYHITGGANLPKRTPIEDDRGLAPGDAQKLRSNLRRHILKK